MANIATQKKVKKKYSFFAHDKEMLRTFMRIPAKEKLEWLEYTNRLLLKYGPKRKIKFESTTKGEISVIKLKQSNLT